MLGRMTEACAIYYIEIYRLKFLSVGGWRIFSVPMCVGRAILTLILFYTANMDSLKVKAGYPDIEQRAAHMAAMCRPSLGACTAPIVK